jgi:hypothetical protein
VAAKDERLYDAVARIHEQFGDSAMIEQYIDGRELNVSVLWKDNDAIVLPLAEIDFSAFDASRVKIVGYEAKWRQDSFEYQNTPRVIPAPLPDEVAGQVRQLAISACRAVGCDDYCRVDFRLDDQLRPFILEVNANPDISPEAACRRAAAPESPSRNLSPPASTAPRPDAQSFGRADGDRPTPIDGRRSACADRRSGADHRHAGEHALFYPAEVEVAREVRPNPSATGPPAITSRWSSKRAAASSVGSVLAPRRARWGPSTFTGWPWTTRPRIGDSARCCWTTRIGASPSAKAG